MIPGAEECDALDMKALQQGEDSALDRLMNRWQSPLRGFLFRYTQNEQDACDLAQETFVRVYQQRGRFRTGARFSTWLFAIALNLARDRARRHARRPVQTLESVPEPVDTANPLSSVEQAERMRAVREAIKHLPDELRAAVVLFEYEDKSHAEIGEVMGVSPKAVETRLYRARQHLRTALARYFGKTGATQSV
jgi:RNA polymerase sigma-70 factor (ECF subfamily)